METSRTAQTLADNLNRLMESRADLDSNPKLSKRSGLPVSTLSRLRNGNVEATLQVVERLADAFAISPARLIDTEAAAWPFSRDLLAAVALMHPEHLVILENVMRATLRMEPIGLPESERAIVRLDTDQTQSHRDEQSATDELRETRYADTASKVNSSGLSSVKLAPKWSGKSVFSTTKKDGAKDGARSTNRKAPRK